MADITEKLLLPKLLIGSLLFILACESAVMREFNTHMAGSDFRSAEQMLERELSQNPNSAEANFLMGNVLSREKQYTEANTYFERSLNSSSMYREHIDYLKERNYRLELNAGIDAWERERFQQTVQLLTYANQIYPERIEVYPTLGSALTETGQHEDAQHMYLQCLNFEPENFQCGLNLAKSYYSTSMYDEAIRIAQEFSEYYSTNATFLKILAYSNFETGHLDQAQDAFDRKLNLQVNNEAIKQFAIELNNIGEIYRAEQYFRRYLERMPRDKDVLSALSYIYLETGNFRLMVQANERLVAMEPANRQLKENLMLAYELHGDIDNYRAIKSDLGLD
ncbi:MAG: tetratricopeptide repeat protein [Balneolaceae bacterium]|nr:tetratricopeptide repeat protein [Balneolaceae bacterium]